MARRPSTNRRAAKRGSPSHSTEHPGKVRREQPVPSRMIARAHLRRQASPSSAFSPPRKSATASYGLCNPDPTSVACMNATLSYGACIRTPERTRKSKCSLFVPCRGVLRPISATERPDLHFCNRLRFSVHPNGITNKGIRPRSYRGAHVSLSQNDELSIIGESVVPSSSLLSQSKRRLDRQWMLQAARIRRHGWLGCRRSPPHGPTVAT